MGHHSRNKKPFRFDKQGDSSSYPGQSRQGRYSGGSGSPGNDRQGESSGIVRKGSTTFTRDSAGNLRRERSTGPAERYYSKLPAYAREVGPAEDKKREKSNEVPRTYDGTGYRRENDMENRQASWQRGASPISRQDNQGGRDRQAQQNYGSRQDNLGSKGNFRQKPGEMVSKPDFRQRPGEMESKPDSRQYARNIERGYPPKNKVPGIATRFRDIDLRSIARDAMKRYGFVADFPKSVIAQVNSVDPTAPDKVKQARDLRPLL
ncbi:MAG TPA: hypothetical protein PLO51_01485, partial [Candidatus Micrarchaeota archaeon]|nr:hypothetical protein [Candidatus Micrarchaeota archaeon]